MYVFSYGQIYFVCGGGGGGGVGGGEVDAVNVVGGGSGFIGVGGFGSGVVRGGIVYSDK